MIVTRKDAQRILRTRFSDPKYAGKYIGARWFLLTKHRPHRLLGGHETKRGAQEQEAAIHVRRGNPIPKPRKSQGAIGRQVWRALGKHRRRVSLTKLERETGLSEYDVHRGIDWLSQHGYARRWGSDVEPLHASFAVNPEENPKPFLDRKHDWDEVLIARGTKRLTRRQIRDYYRRNEKKIWPFLENQTVMVIFAASKNVFIRRRNGPDGKCIKITKKRGIDDPRSYEYWINRRVIEFHPVLTSRTSPLLWLDLDMHETKNAATRKKLYGKMKRAVPRLKKIFGEMGVKDVHVYTSGADGGIHLDGNLPGRRSVDPLRKRLRKSLQTAFEGDETFTVGRSKSGQIRLDTTTFHRLGSLRAPYSMSVTGQAKKPLETK